MVNWRHIGGWGLGSWMGSAIALAAPAIALCPAALPGVMADIAARPVLHRAHLGVQVETLTGDVVYSREGDRFFVPASTLKMLTTAAVLTALGPDATLRTPIWGTVNAEGVATLQVIGQGDPSLDSQDLAALATQLVGQGVRQVDVLYGDDRAFPGDPVNRHWEWEDIQAGYGAPANALILNGNAIGLSLVPQAVGQPLQVVWDDPANATRWTVDNTTVTVAPGTPEFLQVGRDLGRPVLRVGGQLVAGAEPAATAIAEPQPSQAFLLALRRELARQRVGVREIALTPPPLTADWRELAAVSSPPLAALLVPTNQNSNNLYAEALLKQLGRQTPDAPDATEAGIAIALPILANLGVDPTALVMVDGAGLARKNLVTPAALVDGLQGMARSPHATVYRDSLAIAGVSGTLRNRWQNTPVAGRLWGKSGAISRNFALAGYLHPEGYPPLAFSILVNNVNERGTVVRPLIDEIVLHLAALQPCPPE